MATKKNNFIEADLEWAEQNLATWKQYIDENPIHLLKDRKDWKQLKGGGAMPVVIQTIEAQIKSIRDTMKDYLAMLDVVKKLRAEEAAKKEARGDADVPARMQ
ncbi:MAG TPA: hypothetical protein PLS56_01425 [Candidatus Dojkabacteria bacterium]|nr:hypothetical protein [Candidatus Dojkabacteria bacterium]